MLYYTAHTSHYVCFLLILLLGKGNGWVATSAPDKGGQAIVQLQQNANGEEVAVVRHVNFIGKDGLNARIVDGLPILRKKRQFYFKAVSSTTHDDRRKTPFALKFDSNDAADEFEMWWYVYTKNDSIEAWLTEKKGKGENKLPVQESANANEPAGFSASDELKVSKNTDAGSVADDESNTNSVADDDSDEDANGSDTGDSNEGQEEFLMIDYGSAPATQNFMESFDYST